MKALVTGGTGFTGKALVRRLIDAGHQVVALDYKEGLKTQELKEWGAEVIIGSVTETDVVAKSVQGVEIVFHLAAAFREMNVPDSFYYDVNVQGTANVLEAALKAGVKRFIYCSTQGVHGNVDNPPGDESSPIQPADYYQQTKYEGEVVCGKHQGGKMKIVILRPTAIYGPGDHERFTMIFKRVASGMFPMFGAGKTFYHPVYIDNLTDAFLTVMQDGVGDGQAYIIADQEYVELNDLVQRVAKVMGVQLRVPHYPLWPLIVAGHVCEKACAPFGLTPPIFPRRVDWFRQNRAFKIDKAKRELGYQPKVGLDDGLGRMYKWLCQEGYLSKPSGSKPSGCCR
ncbi:MAG: NAD(P)-dependent oxidoreductase [Deltaproteobacteria bacterium]|nr:NAD(P)-dependent oxidoreductase [Deltaproteobacteria bacterium]